MTPGGPEGTALGYLVVHDGGPERQVPIYDQLFVGRECAGIGQARRLVIDDPEISRTHLEIRLDAASNQAFVIDTSTNGTLLNGIRLERAVPRPIKPGDEIRIGDIALAFRSELFAAANQAAGAPPGLTRTRISQAAMVLVVGDIINYSTMSQVTDEQVIAHGLHTLWHEVGGILQAHDGTLNHTPAMRSSRFGKQPGSRMPPTGRSISPSPPIGWSTSWRRNSCCATRTAPRSGWGGVWCRGWWCWPP